MSGDLTGLCLYIIVVEKFSVGWKTVLDIEHWKIIHFHVQVSAQNIDREETLKNRHKTHRQTQKKHNKIKTKIQRKNQHALLALTFYIFI